MGSTFSGLEVGKRSLSAHQQAIQTTGHNISNADNKNFARQRVTISAMDPLYDPSLSRPKVAGQIGQGADVARIERIRDAFLDDRIIETVNKKEFWGAKNDYLYQLETVFNEPNGITLRTQMDQFWNSWEDLSNYPEENAHRSVVIEKANALGSRMEDIYKKLVQLRDNANKEFETKASMVNQIAQNIRTLNEKIQKIEALGDTPNDLYDKRDAQVQELSGIVDVTVSRSDKDEFMVYIGEQILVQGQKGNSILLKGNPENNGYPDLEWDTGKPVLLKGGKLLALMDIRDRVIKEKIDQVDSLAINVMDVLNEIHKDGFGINGKTNLNFFAVKSLSSLPTGEYDSNGDGVNDRTALFRVTGRVTTDPDKQIGISGNLVFHKPDKDSTPVVIPYSKDDTLNDVIKRINRSKVGISAYMNHDNQLALKAGIASDNSKNNFMIRHLEDSGELLVGLTGILNASGPSGAFDFTKIGELGKLQSRQEDISFTPYYHPASFVRISADISGNPASISAGRGKDVGGTGDYNTPSGHKDGTNALLIASFLREKPMMVENSKNPEDFYSMLIAKMGTEAREAKQEFSTQNDLVTELENMRQSVMGVSLDEEMANMVQFQHSYNAAARLISTVNEMLDTIINRLGR